MATLLIGSAEYMQKYGGGLSFPTYLMLNLPYDCNYRCKKCCNANYPLKGKPLSNHEILNLIGEAPKHGFKVLVFSGRGEPFKNPSIQRYIVKADEVGLIPYLFTNGSYLSWSSYQEFLKKKRASLIVNLDTCDENLYKELTGGQGNFYQVVMGIEHISLDELRAESIRLGYPGNLNLIDPFPLFTRTNGDILTRIGINTVVSAHNLNELDSIKNVVDGFKGMVAWVLNTPMQRGNAEGNPDFEVSEEVLRRIAEFGLTPYGTLPSGDKCHYMASGVSFDADGYQLACGYALETAGQLGNLRTDGLEKCIEKAQQLNERFFGRVNHPRCALRGLDIIGLGGN